MPHQVTASEHARSCAIFTAGHAPDGRWRPVPCDCHIGESEA